MPAGSAAEADALTALAAAPDDPARHRLFAGLLEGDGPLRLGGTPERHAALGLLEAPGARLRRADLTHADLRGANLERAFLAQAVLGAARLDGARLRGADLSHADLRDAAMGEADLAGALMEEADLSGAGLRFADLTDAAVEGAKLKGADLWGAKLGGADLSGADLSGAVLHEVQAAGTCFAGCTLAGAQLVDIDAAAASFAGADLRTATLKGNLAGADLTGARLQGVDLSRCELTGARLAKAQLSFTVLSRAQLGVAVGEESVRDWIGAASAYTALERNFRDLGDVDASSWAYLRKRRMQKRAVAARAWTHWRAGRRWPAAGDAATWVGDSIAERVCDYGESVGRVFVTMLLVFIGFALLYAITGSVERTDGGVRAITRHPGDILLFSLSSMSSSAGNATYLAPSHSYASLFAGLQAAISLFLMGLLGFVAGNRIRR